MVVTNSKILIVDDDDDILTAGKLLLKRHYGTIMTCNIPDDVLGLMAEQSFDVILLDMNFGSGHSSGEQGLYWLSRILEIDSQAIVVMITAHGGLALAVEAIKQGATEFITKPWQNEKLVATVSAGVKLRQSRVDAENLRNTNKALSCVARGSEQSILGSSKSMQAVMTLVSRAAPTDANVLILGENGTGKELIARELHKQSKRADGIFMSIDLGALTESLFESELFGHKKGAFTDAKTDRVGRLQAAHGGTLFLDEIGNLPLHLQSKLLTVLEQRKVTPVGADKAVAFDVRVIAATNTPIEKLYHEATFRQDLLYRLNTVEIVLPPLCMRRSDIPEIAQYYTQVYQQKYNKPVKRLSPLILDAITAHDWPGNVRALRHAIERAVILCDDGELSVTDFQLGIKPSSALSNPMTYDSESDNTSVHHDIDLNLERIERQTVEHALKKHSYNISHAARDLGLTRAALYRRMEKYGF